LLTIRTTLALLATALLCTASLADDIPVAPGDGTLSKAARRAHKGDVLVLAPGEYTDSVSLPRGVSIRGAGADETTLIADGYAAITSDESTGVTISGLTIKPGEGTQRGVAAEGPVRLIRVRFDTIPEAAALRGSPLSDVLFCEFIDCNIGVRAIAGSSPTVYGCVFRGGRMGVFVLEGAPYIRNNVFTGMAEGVRIFSDNMPILRNNLFIACTETAMFISERERSSIGPSVRNNVYIGCATVAAVSDPKLLRGLGHGVVFPATDAPFRSKQGQAAPEPLSEPLPDTFATADPGITLADDFTLTVADRSMLDGKGVRLCSDPDDAVGDLGPIPELTRFGVHAPDDAQLPPERFTAPVYIANSIGEEYLALSMMVLRSRGQSLQNGPEGPRDVFDTRRGEIVFSIERFFGE